MLVLSNVKKMVIFQKSLSSSVRRTSLSLLRKIVEHMQASNLRSASRASNSSPSSSDRTIPEEAESLVSVVVSVLDQEEDYDGQEQVMLILASLLRKDPELWVGELVRLGVFERVQAMAKEPPPSIDEDIEEMDKAEELNTKNLQGKLGFFGLIFCNFASKIVEKGTSPIVLLNFVFYLIGSFFKSEIVLYFALI